MPNRVLVTNPAPAPYRFGLQSVLDQMPATPPHWVNGVEFAPDGCAQASLWPDPCGPNPPVEPFTVTFSITDEHCTVRFELTSDQVGAPADTSNIFITPSVDPAGAAPEDLPRCGDDTPVIMQLEGNPVVNGFTSDTGANTYLLGQEGFSTGPFSVTVTVDDAIVVMSFSVEADGSLSGETVTTLFTPYHVSVTAQMPTGTADRDLTITFAPEAAVPWNTGDAPLEIVSDWDGAPHDLTVTDDLSGQSFTGSYDGIGNDDEVVTVDITADPDTPTIFTSKEFDDGLDFDHGDPFTLYHGLLCTILDLAEARNAVASRFSYAEPRALELAFWGGEPGQYPALATDPGLVILPAAANIEDAVAALEFELGQRYGGVGIIHAPRQAMPYAASFNLIVQDGPVLTTPLGTLWAFGGGYDPAIVPTGQDAILDNQSWLYATGAMTSRKTEVLVLPQDGNAINRQTNETTVLAERTWVLTRDCVTLAVLVNLGEVT